MWDKAARYYIRVLKQRYVFWTELGYKEVILDIYRDAKEGLELLGCALRDTLLICLCPLWILLLPLLVGIKVIVNWKRIQGLDR